MCGICGELRFDGRAADSGDIRRMMQVLVPRGPDSEGLHSDGPLALGHRRLAIIDLSKQASQPMLDAETGNVLVFNGTIYNYRELTALLQQKGHRFISSGDSEVILKAYAEWGERCVDHLTGMFAFAIWDSRQQRLFLGRDRLGIKPLYYTVDDKRFRFASNPQALLAAGGVDTAIDSVALHHHFSLHAVVPAPRTILKGIRKLPPATVMQVTTNAALKHDSYWQLQARRPAIPMSDAEWLTAVHDALKTSVERRRLAADVPVGVLLSGGLDSSLLVALLCEAGAGENLMTFSVGFEDMPEEKGSEFEYSDQVVARYGTQHHRIHIANDQVLSRLPEAVDAMAEPMVGQDAVAFYLLAEQVSQSVKVVQSGQGADEVFGGYFWYPRMAAAEGDDLTRFREHYFDRDHDEYLSMVQPSFHGPDHTGDYVSRELALPEADDYIDRVLRLDVTTLVVDDPVKRVDNMTMAWGLEARVPFLDHDLVELAASMPASLKLADGGKTLLKRLSRGRLPDAVIDRPKGYFPVPALKFVRGPFLDFMKEVLNSTACRQRGLYQRAYVDLLLAAPDRHFTRIQGSKLWHLALLEFWLQRNVDAVAGTQ